MPRMGTQITVLGPITKLGFASFCKPWPAHCNQFVPPLDIKYTITNTFFLENITICFKILCETTATVTTVNTRNSIFATEIPVLG